ncbi:MAG: hypothetical protein ACJA2Q_001412 [Pseudohongiellaceae bacterium]|jgi:hypothetical protein
MNNNLFSKSDHRANSAAQREPPLNAPPQNHTTDNLDLLNARIAALSPVPTKPTQARQLYLQPTF